MLTRSETTVTLPTVVPGARSTASSEQLVLTIVFHPDSSRVGERAVIPSRFGAQAWPVGRRTPGFKGAGDAVRPLSDAHVSRCALSFSYSNGRLAIQRNAGSSRCRIGQCELEGSELFSRAQLRTGVTMLLAHRVVLLLRLAPTHERCAQSGFGDSSLRGGSAAMGRLRRQLAQAAATDEDVLLLGETGTGKELAAGLLHRGSERSAAPLVSVNVAAIPAELAAAALFGAARGAFTGSAAEQCGYFERAQGGCLFLDEIGDAGSGIQPLLLRALQQREIQRVGGAVRRVDVRVISATDAAIDDEGSGFKSALRHRLGACEIRLPALREHPEDIGELLLYFLEENRRKSAVSAFELADDPRVLAGWAMIFYQCMHYDWPGNVRQLANIASQLVMSDQRVPDLPSNLRQVLYTDAHCRTGSAPARQMRDVPDEAFSQAMKAAGFEPGRVARLLGVSRTSVYRRIEGSADYRLAHEVPPAEIREVLAQCDGDVRQAALSLGVSGNSLERQLRQVLPT